MRQIADPVSTHSRYPRGLRLAVAALATGLILGTAMPAVSQAATLYTLTGHGFGHGVGMSQYGAYGYAKHTWKFRQILRHYFSGTTVTAVGNVNVRVLMKDAAPRISLSSSARITAYDERTRRRKYVPAGHIVVTSVVGSKLHAVDITAGRFLGDFTGPLRMSANGTPVRMHTANANGQARLTYRGYFRLLLRGGHVRAVNVLSTEYYLRGVVPAEMPASWHMEALKAQAVAARSYAIAGRRSGDFDLYATTASQYYGAIQAEEKRTNTAVAATARLVVKYGASVISAYFHSTSGGMTENIEKVWGGSSRPWARAVSDPYDSISPYHSWRPRRFTPASLDRALGSYVKGALRAVTITAVGVSPRVRLVKITGSGGASWATGAALRKRLRLRSTWFAFRALSIVTTTTVISYGRATSVIGHVRPAPTPNAAGRRLVTFRARRIGSTRWIPYTQLTNAGGDFRRVVKPSAGIVYQIALGSAISPVAVMRVRAVVSLRPSATTAHVGQRVTLSGTVSPNHAGRKVNVKWYSAAGWQPFTSPTLDASSKYRAVFTPTRKGTFYFSTVFPSDSNHLGGVSSVRRVVVN